MCVIVLERICSVFIGSEADTPSVDRRLYSDEEFLPNFGQSLFFEMFSPKFSHALIFVVTV